jgi:hypothetical protein
VRWSDFHSKLNVIIISFILHMSDSLTDMVREEITALFECGIRPCRGCGRLSAKIAGCNWVYCEECGHEGCWKCGIWIPHTWEASEDHGCDDTELREWAIADIVEQVKLSLAQSELETAAEESSVEPESKTIQVCWVLVSVLEMRAMDDFGWFERKSQEM